jgi:hypothetical protein
VDVVGLAVDGTEVGLMLKLFEYVSKLISIRSKTEIYLGALVVIVTLRMRLFKLSVIYTLPSEIGENT